MSAYVTTFIANNRRVISKEGNVSQYCELLNVAFLKNISYTKKDCCLMFGDEKINIILSHSISIE